MKHKAYPEHKWSCGSEHLSSFCSGAVDRGDWLQCLPSAVLFSDTYEHEVTAPAAAGSTFASRDQHCYPRLQVHHLIRGYYSGRQTRPEVPGPSGVGQEAAVGAVAAAD